MLKLLNSASPRPHLTDLMRIIRSLLGRPSCGAETQHVTAQDHQPQSHHSMHRDHTSISQVQPQRLTSPGPQALPCLDPHHLICDTNIRCKIMTSLSISPRITALQHRVYLQHGKRCSIPNLRTKVATIVVQPCHVLLNPQITDHLTARNSLRTICDDFSSSTSQAEVERVSVSYNV